MLCGGSKALPLFDVQKLLRRGVSIQIDGGRVQFLYWRNRVPRGTSHALGWIEIFNRRGPLFQPWTLHSLLDEFLSRSLRHYVNGLCNPNTNLWDSSEYILIKYVTGLSANLPEASDPNSITARGLHWFESNWLFKGQVAELGPNTCNKRSVAGGHAREHVPLVVTLQDDRSRDTK